MGLAPAELGAGGNLCGRIKIKPGGCWRGRWERSSEISRVCKTAAQTQDLNGVVIQATFAWKYLMPKCLKIFSLKIVTNK